MKFDKLIELIFSALILGGMGWCTWTTVTLMEIQKDIALIKQEKSVVEKEEKIDRISQDRKKLESKLF